MPRSVAYLGLPQSCLLVQDLPTHLAAQQLAGGEAVPAFNCPTPSACHFSSLTLLVGERCLSCLPHFKDMKKSMKSNGLLLGAVTITHLAAQQLAGGEAVPAGVQPPAGLLRAPVLLSRAPSRIQGFLASLVAPRSGSCTPERCGRCLSRWRPRSSILIADPSRAWQHDTREAPTCTAS